MKIDYVSEIVILLYYFFLLGVQLCFRRFFSEIRGFIVKTCYTFMIHNIVHGWPLLSPIFRVAYESREKTGHLLRRIHESIQFFTSS